jgi:hypothetical protein
MASVAISPTTYKGLAAIIDEHGSPMKRYLLPLAAFLCGAALITSVYLGFLTWAKDWNYAVSQLERDRAYVLPIIIAFGIQSSLYSVIRFHLFGPVATTAHPGAMVGANGATSTASMVACCLHHVTNVLPILGISAMAGFLARYQRPLMQVGLAMNLIGILVMLVVLYRARQNPNPVLEPA